MEKWVRLERLVYRAIGAEMDLSVLEDSLAYVVKMDPSVCPVNKAILATLDDGALKVRSKWHLLH